LEVIVEGFSRGDNGEDLVEQEVGHGDQGEFDGLSGSSEAVISTRSRLVIGIWGREFWGR
jgi:hypothetical protein